MPDDEDEKFDSPVDDDVDEVDDEEQDEYDINDPRTREHEAYKIAQRNGAAAARRFRYGDDVDADGTNYDPDEADNEDSQEQRLENAREARAWALDEATRRYEWNGKWAGGEHEGVEEQADLRMRDVERWNVEIANRERQIDHAQDAIAHNPTDDSDSDSDSDEEDFAEDSDEEYEKNIQDDREARERRYDDDNIDEVQDGEESSVSSEEGDRYEEYSYDDETGHSGDENDDENIY